MADKAISDLLMKFHGPKGLISGETSTDLGPQSSSKDSLAAWLEHVKANPLVKGFIAGKMLEVTDFKLLTGLGSGDDDDKQKQLAADVKQQGDEVRRLREELAKMHKAAGTTMGPGGRARSQGSQFSKFIQGDSNAKYPVDMKPVEFSRSIDRASAELMQHCINRTVFTMVSIIKRRPTGGPWSGEVFLRIDFEDVMLTTIDWNDDEPIKESVEFVCRKVTIQYLPQLPDGTLGGAKSASWDARASGN